MPFGFRIAPSATRLGTSLRRHPRLLFSVPMKLRLLAAGGIRTHRGVSLDISESGMGALVEGRLGIGDTVQIELTLPSCELDAIAVVRHSSTLRSGFEFIGLTAEERASIAQMVP